MNTFQTTAFVCRSILAFALVGLTACASAPQGDRQPASERNFNNLVLLGRNQDAYAAKRMLIQSVKPKGTIDLAYFIIDDDPTSARLMEDLLAKADEGVRVRVLVDYFMSVRQIPTLLLLEKHPLIEVRRFRPPTPKLIAELEAQKIDSGKFLAGIMLTDKDRVLESVAASPLLPEIKEAVTKMKAFRGVEPGVAMQQLELPMVMGIARRMGELAPLVTELRTFLRRIHHKLLLVDDECFVMGGRNVSDEYHADLGDPLLRTRNYPFQDTDIAGCAAGNEQKRSFETLWNSPVATPITAANPGTGASRAASRERLERQAKGADRLGKLVLSRAAVPLPDSPGKLHENLIGDVLGPNTRGEHDITTAYLERIRKARNRIDIVSAYFCVDTANKEPRLNQLYEELIAAAKRGVDVNVYTNSIASTDLNMVNLVAFLKYRELLDAGVKILELGPGQGSLHTKSAAFDEDHLLVGSYNMDPRSHLYDTNNLLELRDPGGKRGLTRAFRQARIEALRWTPADPAQIEQIMTAKKREVELFRAVRELL
ncbi:MAG: phosphatidylserine/phosphatidylglycerophosphate/cardiolipin synthase family protein [Oligoflexia bacterium]|nr:phosphatidylserine/phosphatidylglycerophosphate/cardiolipin synthase family protein [Oligoflexia bacterium]